MTFIDALKDAVRSADYKRIRELHAVYHRQSSDDRVLEYPDAKTLFSAFFELEDAHEALRKAQGRALGCTLGLQDSIDRAVLERESANRP